VLYSEHMDKSTSPAILPSFFKHILWSYDFSALHLDKDKKTIIIQSINYGDLMHWRWLVRHYGEVAIREVLETIPVSEFRPGALRLATIMFSVTYLNHAHRGAH
jgi:hypothetical protein